MNSPALNIAPKKLGSLLGISEPFETARERYKTNVERVGGAAVVLNSEGKVLLVHHTYGECNWELPGGAGERGESPTETALRELREETGLQATPIRITGWYYDPDVDRLHVVVLCEDLEGQDPLPDEAEVSECRFWDPDGLPVPHSDFTKLRIQDALNSAQPEPLLTVIGPRQWIR